MNTTVSTRTRTAPVTPRRERMIHVCAVGRLNGEPIIHEVLCFAWEREPVMASLMRRIDDATVFVMA